MIRILFFAQARVATGISETSLPLEKASSVMFLWQYLTVLYPTLGELREKTRVARNGNFVQGDETFSDGDEIALIPPVSGG